MTRIDLRYTLLSEVADEGLRAKYYALLSDAERDEHDRKRRPENRHQYLVARALLRDMLARATGQHEIVWEFLRSPHGKPQLAAGGPWQFNIAHTTGMCACIVARTHSVGVDVEHLDRRVNLQIANRYFAEAEVAQLEAAPAELRPSRFLDFWTLKEAYIKACGLGLALPLGRFAFTLSSHEPLGITFIPPYEDDPQRWSFLLETPHPNFRLAAAVCHAVGESIEWDVAHHVPFADHA